MKRQPCPRLFEAEAMRDGRLAGAERAGFQRHLKVCSACSREVQALDALAESLRASPPDDAAADELRVRRERTRLLAAFDGVLMAPSSGSVWHWRLWPATGAALVVAILLLPRVRRPAEAPARSSMAVVHADSTAVWTQRMVAGRENVVLEHGALWIHIDHPSGGGRLLVVLPDGELEDIGTTFMVSADDGHTTRIAVQEGHVVLRLRSRAPIALGPGDTWMPDPRPVASGAASGAPSIDPAPTFRIEPGERRMPPPRPSASLVASDASDPSLDFRAAMAALDLGDNHQAATAFADFLQRYPRDPRSEDAAYLRVVAIQRSGDRAGTKQAALEYLRRYPAGFRQAEVEILSR